MGNIQIGHAVECITEQGIRAIRNTATIQIPNDSIAFTWAKWFSSLLAQKLVKNNILLLSFNINRTQYITLMSDRTLWIEMALICNTISINFSLQIVDSFFSHPWSSSAVTPSTQLYTAEAEHFIDYENLSIEKHFMNRILF